MEDSERKKCDICGRRFALSQDFKDHIISHLSEGGVEQQNVNKSKAHLPREQRNAEKSNNTFPVECKVSGRVIKEDRDQHQSDIRVKHIKGKSPTPQKVLPPCVKKKNMYRVKVRTDNHSSCRAIKTYINDSIKSGIKSGIKSSSGNTFCPEAHQSGMTLKCDVCGKRFLNAKTLAEHVSLHNASDMLSIDDVKPQFLSTPVCDDNVKVQITRLSGCTTQLEGVSPMPNVSPEAESTRSETTSFSTRTLRLRPSSTSLDEVRIAHKKRKIDNSTSTFSTSQQSSESTKCTRAKQLDIGVEQCRKKSAPPRRVKKHFTKGRWLLRGKKRCVGNGENVVKPLTEENACKRSLRKRVLGSGICLKPKSLNKLHHQADARGNGRLGVNDELCKDLKVLIQDSNVKSFTLSKSESVSKTRCTGDIGNKNHENGFAQTHFSTANEKPVKQLRVLVEDFSKLSAKLPKSSIKGSKVRKPCDTVKRTEYTDDFQNSFIPVQRLKQLRVVVEDLKIGDAEHFGNSSKRKISQNCDESVLGGVQANDNVCVNESQRKTRQNVYAQGSVDVNEHLLMNDSVNGCGRQTRENTAEHVAEKRWKCIVCGKRYQETDVFIDHLNSHSSEDPSTLQSLISMSQIHGRVMPENSVNGTSSTKMGKVPQEGHLPVLDERDSFSKHVGLIPKNSDAGVGKPEVGEVPDEIGKDLVKESLHVPGESGLSSVSTDAVLKIPEAGISDVGNVPGGEVNTGELQRDVCESYKCEYCSRRFRRLVSFIQHVATHEDAEILTNRNFFDVQSQEKGVEEKIQHSIEDQSVKERTNGQLLCKESSVQGAATTDGTELEKIPEALHNEEQRFAQGPDDTKTVAAVESDLLLKSAGFEAIGECTNSSGKIADCCDGFDSSLWQKSNYTRRVKCEVCGRRVVDKNKLIVHMGSHVMDESPDHSNIKSHCPPTVTVTESALLPKAAEATQATLPNEVEVDSGLGHTLKERKPKEEVAETDGRNAIQTIAETNRDGGTSYNGSVRQVDVDVEEIATCNGVEEYDDNEETLESENDESEMDYVVKKEEDWDETDTEDSTVQQVEIQENEILKKSEIADSKTDEVKLSGDEVLRDIMREELLSEDRKVSADVTLATPQKEIIHRDDQLGPNLETVTSAKSTAKASSSGVLGDGTVLVGEDQKGARSGTLGRGTDLDNKDDTDDKNESKHAKENADGKEPEKIIEVLDGVEVGNVGDAQDPDASDSDVPHNAIQSLDKLTSSLQVELEKIQVKTKMHCGYLDVQGVTALSQTVQGTEHQDSVQIQGMNNATAMKPKQAQELKQQNQERQTSNFSLSFKPQSSDMKYQRPVHTQNDGQAFDLGNNQYSPQWTGLSGNRNRPQAHPLVTANIQSFQIQSQWLQNGRTPWRPPTWNNQPTTVQNASTFKDHLPINFGTTNHFLRAARYPGPTNSLSDPNGFSASQFPFRYAGNSPPHQFPLSCTANQYPLWSPNNEGLNGYISSQHSLGNYASHRPNVAYNPYYGQSPRQFYSTDPAHHPAQHPMGPHHLPNFADRDMGQVRFDNYFSTLANQHGQRLDASQAGSEYPLFPINDRIRPAANFLDTRQPIQKTDLAMMPSRAEHGPNQMHHSTVPQFGTASQQSNYDLTVTSQSVNETDNISDDIYPESPSQCPATPMLCINVEPLDSQSESVAPVCHEGDTSGNNKEAEASPMQTRKSKGNKSFSSKQFQVKCDLCGKKFASNNSLKRHMALHSSKYICQVCGRALSTKTSYDGHMKTHDKSFQCDICSKSFGSISSLFKHKRVVHNEKVKVGEAAGVLLRYYNCSVCGIAFDKPSHLAEHEKSHLGDDQTNDIASPSKSSQKYPGMPEGKDDMSEGDNSPIIIDADSPEENIDAQDLLKCQICGWVLETLEKLRSHASKHLKCYKCYICEKMYASSKSLRRHLLTHTGRSKADAKRHMDANLGCSNVDQARDVISANGESESTTKEPRSQVYELDSPESHYVHLESQGQDDHSGHQFGKPKEDNQKKASNIAGNSCDIAALTKISLGLQESSGSEDNTENLCDVEDGSDEGDDDIMIISEDVDDRDSDVHSSEPNQNNAAHDVSVIDVISNQKSTDSRNKQFTCEVCGVCFSCPSALTQHHKTHTHELPYCCDICGGKFAQMGNLITHLQDHTSEKPCKCSGCGEVFRSQGSLNIHVSQECGSNPLKPNSAKHDGDHSKCSVSEEDVTDANSGGHGDYDVELFDMDQGARQSIENIATKPDGELRILSGRTTSATILRNAQFSAGNSQVPARTALGDAQMPALIQQGGTQVFGSNHMPDKTRQGNTKVPAGTKLKTTHMQSGTALGNNQVSAGTIVDAQMSGTVQGDTQMPAGTVQGDTQMPAGTVQGDTQMPAGTVQGDAQMPAGTVQSDIQMPAGTVQGDTQMPAGTVQGDAQMPAGTVQSDTQMPAGTVQGDAQMPAGTVLGNSQIQAETSLVSGVKKNLEAVDDVSAMTLHRSDPDPTSPEHSKEYKIGDIYLICKECYAPSRSLEHLQHHLAVCHSMKCEYVDLERKSKPIKIKAAYACGVCHYTYFSLDDFLGHVKEQHGDLDLAFKKKTLECEKCNGVLGESCKCYTKEHASRKGSFKCTVCGKMLGTSVAVKKHMMRHTGEKSLICEVCGMRFRQKTALGFHLMVHNDVWLFKCDKCDRRFRTKGPYNTHMKEHYSEYQCEICGKTLVNQNNLDKHKRQVHENIWPFTCERCGKGFCKERNLHRHLRTCGRGYHCDQCDKMYKSRRELKLHTLVHTGEQKEFKCDFCDFSFNTKYELDRHRMTHTGERPYSCQYCSKTFTQNFYLRTHMKSHNIQIKHFPCNKCEESFEFKRDLTKHKEEKHGGGDEKPRYRRKLWNCDECGKSFRLQRQLTRHQKEEHPQESSDESSDDNDAEILQLSDGEEDANNSTKSDSNDSSDTESE